VARARKWGFAQLLPTAGFPSAAKGPKGALVILAPDPYAALEAELAPARASLLAHPVYRAVRDRAGLGVFMGAHVFAVWDFMSLLKSLQHRLTGVSVPWTPPRSRTAARLVNEIVLAEESDEVTSGVTMSHFELYLDAMRELAFDTTPVTSFVGAIEARVPFGQALAAASTAPYVKQFVEGTLALATDGAVEAIAASFLFGREDLVPAMFRRLLPEVAGARDGVSLRRYLERHIEVDEGAHGPAARTLLVDLCGDDAACWKRASHAARTALAARLSLWDGVVRALGAQARTSSNAIGLL
jgi:hypothetical protein